MIKKFKEWQKKRKLKNDLEDQWRILMAFNIMGVFEAEKELYDGKNYDVLEKELIEWALKEGLTSEEIEEVKNRIRMITI